MKKIFKTFLVTLVAFACMSLVSCTKSAEQIVDEAEELINDDGTINSENIDKVLNLYEAAIDNMTGLKDKCEEASKNMDFDNPDVKEALQLAAVGEALQTALSNSELTPEQEARIAEINKKLK